MAGIEGMTGAAENMSVGLCIPLILAGAVCAYAAFFWEKAKSVLSEGAQNWLARFARSAATKAVLFFAFLISIIFSPYVEQHRWPFSYPTDPAVLADNANMKTAVSNATTALSRERELADKWRFATDLRRGKACGYQMQITSKASGSIGFWKELFEHGGWIEKAGAIALAGAPGSTPSGITLRIKGDEGESARCAGDLQRALSDVYKNPPSRIANNQQSEFLSTCPDCVQIELDY